MTADGPTPGSLASRATTAPRDERLGAHDEARHVPELDAYDFALPAERIAQEPAPEREAARLLKVDYKTVHGKIKSYGISYVKVTVGITQTTPRNWGEGGGGQEYVNG